MRRFLNLVLLAVGVPAFAQAQPPAMTAPAIPVSPRPGPAMGTPAPVQPQPPTRGASTPFVVLLKRPTVFGVLTGRWGNRRLVFVPVPPGPPRPYRAP